ncbi:MAG: hypothetical protein R2852_03935 [Bacteroidia bacterium]
MFSPIKLSVWLTLSLCFLVQPFYAQKNTGYPVWPIAVKGGDEAQVVDWSLAPTMSQDVPNTAPSENGPTGAAFDSCGKPLFYVIHSGTLDDNNLFIYTINGTPLLNNQTPNKPGLSCKNTDPEIQVVKVPYQEHQWYIIYCKWKDKLNAPYGNSGSYTPAEVLYSKVEYKNGVFKLLTRDSVLKVSGVAHVYTIGKAVSRTAVLDKTHYLYLCRRPGDVNYLSIDRFIIDSSGISFDANTGNVSARWWYQTVAGSVMELSPTEDRLALINRNESSNSSDIFIFKTSTFSNRSSDYTSITLSDLILQADNNVLLTSNSINQVAYSNSNLSFIKSIERKIRGLEFSPNGRFLYFCGGGYAGSGQTHMTYLAQIDLGLPSSPATYPYDVRLQIQKPSGIFNPISGNGDSYANGYDNWHALISIASSYDGNLYFTKGASSTLFVLPNANALMPQNLVPSEIDLSTASINNIKVEGDAMFLPDQIDGYTYLNDRIASLTKILGADTVICKGNTLTIDSKLKPNTIRWQDGSTDSFYIVTKPGVYSIQSTQNLCGFSDSLRVDWGPEVGFDILQNTCNNTLIFTNTSSNAALIQWNIDSFQGSSNNLSYHFKDAGTYSIRLIVSDSNRICPDTLIQTVDILRSNGGELIIPNTFTPNSDGIMIAIH